jgi:hypothetical protein
MYCALPVMHKRGLTCRQEVHNLAQGIDPMLFQPTPRVLGGLAEDSSASYRRSPVSFLRNVSWQLCRSRFKDEGQRPTPPSDGG